MQQNFNGLFAPVMPYAETRFSMGNLSTFPLAMAYVPMQELAETYDPERGFMEGTLFPELNKPFEGTGDAK